MTQMTMMMNKTGRVGNAFLPTTIMNWGGNWWAKKPAHPTVFLHGHPAHQSGVVLVVSLIMLLLLTLIGTVGMQTTSLEEKMAGNSRDQNLAFQSAEAALRAGETRIETLWNAGAGSILFFCNGTAGLFSSVAGCVNAPPALATADLWTNNAKSVVSNTGRYFITYVNAYNAGPPIVPSVFIITAIGRGAAGAQGNTQVILQSYYGGGSAFLP